MKKSLISAMIAAAAALLFLPWWFSEHSQAAQPDQDTAMAPVPAVQNGPLLATINPPDLTEPLTATIDPPGLTEQAAAAIAPPDLTEQAAAVITEPLFVSAQQPMDSDNTNSTMNEEQACCEPAPDKYLAEVKMGYFFFPSGIMRKVYDRGGIDVQLSFAWSFWKFLQLYGSVEYLNKQGNSLPLNYRTSFNCVPLSLGLRGMWNISTSWPVDYYLTLGPRYFFAFVKNESPFVPEHMNANGLGGFANTGFLFHVTRHFRVDLFAEYSYKNLAFHASKNNVTGHTVQIGGLTFGGGLGYSF